MINGEDLRFQYMFKEDLHEKYFHPACIDMTVEEAERLDHFFNESCSAEGQSKLPNPHSAIRHSDTKVFIIIVV
ncbi:hypothetical protein P8452_24139 [Trifolium repens]|nr:hypothetical protein P8452_24139 [Trifolium repens]